MPERIGVFGGTFNPPHKGHIQAAKSAMEQLGLDLVLFIPSGTPPHKRLPEDSPSAIERLEMTRLAIEDLPKAQVSDIELRRRGPSYTADTLDELKTLYPDSQFFLLVGTDMFMTLRDWHRCASIFAGARIAVFSRFEEREAGRVKRQKEILENAYEAEVDIIQNDAMEISSSDIREALHAGRGREYLAPKVYDYILDKGFYCTGSPDSDPCFEKLRSEALGLIDGKRILHVLGCEREAVKLAKRWGADVIKAREAALLHDITKALSMDEQLKLCEKYDIMLDAVERSEKKLLHSKTGAMMAREKFEISDDVYNAIYWHTTGRENMSLLEKVLYLADYIEPTRQFDGVDELRRMAYTDLDGALVLGFEMSINDMMSEGKSVHPRTVEAKNWILNNR